MRRYPVCADDISNRAAQCIGIKLKTLKWLSVINKSRRLQYTCCMLQYEAHCAHDLVFVSASQSGLFRLR